MSERKEKKIRRLQRRIEELEGEVQMLRTLLGDHSASGYHWLHTPCIKPEVVGWDGKIKPDIASSLDYTCTDPMDAPYVSIPSDYISSGHKPGIFQRLKTLLFG